MPLQATSGAASYDAFGGGVPAVPNYIEDVFSTWLYAGTGANQTITNGIDESGKGAMTWIKCRTDATSHALYDTERGAGRFLTPNATSAQSTSGSSRGLSSFNSTGFSLDDDSFSGRTNQSGQNYASWTFRKQPKFFDVVTYTGNGVDGRQIPHNLGSTPGCIIIKSTSGETNWSTWHNGIATNQVLFLNTTDASSAEGDFYATAPTSTVFTVAGFGRVNGSGSTYVAYLFAHNAGGFGLTGTDNVISCGSFTTNSSYEAIIDTIGFEPQWVLTKPTSAAGDWRITDNMRGFASKPANNPVLWPNLSSAEATSGTDTVLSTGFREYNIDANTTHIYIAIRRGPMKVPTDGTKVFLPVSQTGGGTITTNFPVDLSISTLASGTDREFMDRLRGGSQTYYNYLASNLTAAEATGTGAGFGFDNNTGYKDNGFWSGPNVLYYNWRRAPGFFDEVCYTQTTTSGAQAISHNLTVVPELVITKFRNAPYDWYVFPIASNNRLVLNAAGAASTYAPLSSVTSTSFSYPMADLGASIGTTYVAYLFATCPGVSKVGSYTGNGTTQAIACGFTGGARFVLIKATSTTGNWLTFDTARGMTVLTDPVLSLNSTAAETATLGACTTTTGGFTVNEAILAGVNTSGVSYIFLAVA